MGPPHTVPNRHLKPPLPLLLPISNKKDKTHSESRHWLSHKQIPQHNFISLGLVVPNLRIHSINKAYLVLTKIYSLFISQTSKGKTQPNKFKTKTNKKFETPSPPFPPTQNVKVVILSLTQNSNSNKSHFHWKLARSLSLSLSLSEMCNK